MLDPSEVRNCHLGGYILKEGECSCVLFFWPERVGGGGGGG
jgi:hypothetical protein